MVMVPAGPLMPTTLIWPHEVRAVCPTVWGASVAPSTARVARGTPPVVAMATTLMLWLTARVECVVAPVVAEALGVGVLLAALPIHRTSTE